MVSIILDALFFTLIVCCMAVIDFLALGTVLGHTIRSTDQVSLYMVIHGGLVLELFNYVRMRLAYVALCALACPLPHPRETQKNCGTARRLLLGMKRSATRCGLRLLVHTTVESLCRFMPVLLLRCFGDSRFKLMVFRKHSTICSAETFAWDCRSTRARTLRGRRRMKDTIRTSFTNPARTTTSPTVVCYEYTLGPLLSPGAIILFVKALHFQG